MSMDPRKLLWLLTYTRAAYEYRGSPEQRGYANAQAGDAVEDFDAFFREVPAGLPEAAADPLHSLTLGQRIKEAYEARGLTRAAFQRLLQNHDPALATLNYKTIIDWEQGAMPRLEVLRAIASVLGRTIDDFLDAPLVPAAR